MIGRDPNRLVFIVLYVLVALAALLALVGWATAPDAETRSVAIVLLVVAGAMLIAACPFFPDCEWPKGQVVTAAEIARARAKGWNV